MAKKGAPKPKASKPTPEGGPLPDTHTNAPVTSEPSPAAAAATAEAPTTVTETDAPLTALDVAQTPPPDVDNPDDVALDNMCRDVIRRLERAVKTGHGLTIDKELMSEAAKLFRFVIGVGETEDLEPPARTYGRVVPAPPIGHSL